MSTYFDIEADLIDYEVKPEEPYLTQDLLGKYVILQDEVLKCTNPTSSGKPILLYSSEVLVDDNPSQEKIFQMKLKGQFRPSMFVAHHHSKGS